MRVPALFSLIAATLLGFALHTAAFGQASPPSARPGEIIIKFKPGATAAERSAILADLGAVDVEDVRRIGAKHARLGTRSVDEAVARYRGHAKVAFIEPNYLYHAVLTPNDPRFPEMWALQNLGQTGGVPGADINAVSAWDVTTGSAAVLVAITDSGIDWGHPDLAANVFVNPGEVPNNGLDDDGNGYVDDVRGWDFVNHDNDPTDDLGHGTHVAGTIAAVGNNGVGVVGVSWSSRILPLKFLDQFGSGSTIEAINAIDYAANMGARVMNASWGGGDYSEALRLAIQSAADSGMVFVAAAGNSAVDSDVFPMYPAAYDLPSIVSVAATDHRDSLAGFSNYGANSVDLGAPGVDVLSTLPGGYGMGSGTSMAAPHVSGVMALMFARFPALDPVSAKGLLLSRVVPVPSLAGRTVTGGRLDALLAVSDPDDTPPGTLGNLTAVDINGTRVTLQWIATGDDGATGTASRYEVRYSTGLITEENFPQATLASGAPRPAPAGSAESHTVGGLSFATSYYFALRAFDEFGNRSPLSNVASATTLGPPSVSVAPSLLEADLLTGQQTTRVLTVSNVGQAELNFEVTAVNGLPGGVAQAARVVRTFVPPAVAVAAPASATATGSLLADLRAPSYPRSEVPYDFERVAARGPIAPDEVRVTNLSGGSRRILIAHSGGDVSEIRGALGAFQDLSAIDVMNVQSAVPTLNELAAYDAVILVANNPFGDPAGVGNVLADYVDSGGELVMTLATFIAGWEVGGRLKNEGYVPFGTGSGPLGSATLASFDANHPIMAGVTTATGDLLGSVPLASGAEVVAMWSNGQPFVATKGRVSAVNIFVGAPGYWSGDVPLILHNAVLWEASPDWLSADPASGVVPAGGQLGVVVTFDAGELEGGLYGATLLVQSDDPAQPEWAVPATLQVTGVADVELAGEVVTLESAQDYFADGAATQHQLAITVPPGGPVSLRLIAEGDYGDFSETATAIAEGNVLGSVGGVGVDCSTAQSEFQIPPAVWAAVAADGLVNLTVQNSAPVNVFCVPNRHTVRASYQARGDRLDFGPVYLGAHRDLRILVRNSGTDVLQVGSVEVVGAGFSAPTGGFALAAHASMLLEVRFSPVSAQPYAGSLIVHSDDPDEPAIGVPLEGLGMVPPDVAVSPGSIDEDVLTGTAKTRVITIQNQGGSGLDFAISLEGGATAVVTLPGDSGNEAGPGTAGPETLGPPALQGRATTLSALPAEPAAPGAENYGTPPSNGVPSGYVSRLSQPSAMSGATVLLVQDAAPWGTQANESLLLANGMSFDVITTSGLPAVNLLAYRKVIVAADQPTSAYQRLAAQAGQLENYVEAGGVLEFHAAGWGYSGGDASLVRLPGGARVIQSFAGFNYFWVASHPLLVGVPNPLSGTGANHGYYVDLPPGTTVLLGDPNGRPTLIEYTRGLGKVVSGTLTFEYSLLAGRDPGIVLRNMIPYGVSASTGWLSGGPLEGHLNPGEVAEVTLRLDAEGLLGGEYRAQVHVRSNDPDEGDVVVPVTMSVGVAPDIALFGREVSVESTKDFVGSGAVTQHALTLAERPEGQVLAMLDVNGDFGDFFEVAQLSLEGVSIGEAGRTGSDCIAAHAEIPIPNALMQTLSADGVVHATVQNTFDVVQLCLVNQHRVKLLYRSRADSISFGQLFVGSCDTVTFQIVNQGTEVLHLQPLSLAVPGLQVFPSGAAALLPAHGLVVTVVWCPGAPGPLAELLEVRSDDPDDPLLSVGLFGEALIPPEIAVTPESIEDALYTGQVATHLLTIRNDGGSDLVFELDLEGLDAEPVAARAGAPAVLADPNRTEYGPTTSDRTPGGFRAQSSPPIRAADSRFLLVQDYAPWGTTSNETILNANGIPFDRVLSSGLATVDLAGYDKVIVASDQSTATYIQLASRAAQLEDYVRGGGVLEVHAAGWGWSGGDASLFVIPGGVHIVYGGAGMNFVTAPDHPIMAGVPNPFTGTGASHSYFTQIPAEAETLAIDEYGRANLVIYPLGSGAVIAGGQTFEYGYTYGQHTGIILQNMIPFGPATRPDWLSADPLSGRVPAGQSIQIAVRLDATGLGTGDRHAEAVITSNDPDTGERRVPILLHVTGAPDVVLSGQPVSVESTRPYTTDGARTVHDLAASVSPSGDGTLQLIVDGDYGDGFESATAYLEGAFAGEAGRVGVDCFSATGTFPVPQNQLAAALADGSAHVEVQNSFDVNVFCAINQHRVILKYRGSADLLAFGQVFIGSCRTLSVEVANVGTEPLHVQPPGIGNPAFTTVPAGAFEVPAGGAVEVLVSLCPTQVGPAEADLTMQTDDPDEAELRVVLSGSGAVPPDIAVAPAALSEALLPGGSASRTLTIANSGGLPLHYRIEVHQGGAPSPAAPASARPATQPLSAESIARARDSYRAFPGSGAAEVAAPAPLGGRLATPQSLRPSEHANAVVIFNDDIEGDLSGWTHYSPIGGADLWAPSSQRASSGVRSWRVPQHDTNNSNALQTPVIDLAGLTDATLTFSQWYDFDDCFSPDFEGDGGVVEVLEDGTQQWIRIHPVGGYPYVLDDVCGNPLAYAGAYSHINSNHPAFATAAFDLTAFAGKRISLRFLSGWDCGNCDFNEGWYVDDVQVFSSRAPWLSTAPDQGVVPAGGVVDVAVGFDAGGLDPGDYQATLAILSDDPDEPRVDVAVRLWVADVEATLDTEPNTINLGGRGQWITCYLELPGGDPSTIDVSSLRLDFDVPAELAPTALGDQDRDGIPDLMVKFDFEAVRPRLPVGDPIPVLITGMAGGQRLMARQFVRVLRHDVSAPAAGQSFSPGQTAAIEWSVPSDWGGSLASLWYSLDRGVTWHAIVEGVSGSRYDWTVPNHGTTHGMIRVDALDAEGFLAFDLSAEFTILAGTTAVEPPPAAAGPSLANAPNPFSGSGTTLGFSLAAAGEVDLAVFNTAGRKVRVLSRAWMPAGRHQVRWDGRDDRGARLGSGVYFARLRAPGIERTRRMTLIQ